MRLLLNVGSDCAHILPLLDVLSLDTCHVLVYPRMRCDLSTAWLDATAAGTWRVADTLAVARDVLQAMAHLDTLGVRGVLFYIVYVVKNAQK